MSGAGASPGPRLPIVAVVLAGGRGERVGRGMPKQLLEVAGRPIIDYTIDALHACPEIDEMLVVMTPGLVEDVERIVEKVGYDKVAQVIEGGATRQESTYLALRALGDEERGVLLHDAVRPFVDRRIVADCVEALRTYDAVGVVIPSPDTIIAVEGDAIVEVPDRGRLRRVQTPQAFRLSTLRRAHDLAVADPDLAVTDDCTVVLRYLPEVAVHVVEGSERNVKITHPVDVFLAETLLELRTRGADGR
ncbi:MAG: 2-C-methyl-D-erythritol 4-phosphate cytidylyltransferase [Streptosporangiaceae bacterium]